MSTMSDKSRRYLSLFGLSWNFTQEELLSAYRTLAKLNHPDIHRDATAQMRMVIINDGYRFLKEGLIVPPESLAQEVKTAEDPAYILYRRGFDILSRAFDEYYSEGAQVRSERMEKFLNELRAAKTELASVIREYPDSSWTADAIDKVMSINMWLDT